MTPNHVSASPVLLIIFSFLLFRAFRGFLIWSRNLGCLIELDDALIFLCQGPKVSPDGFVIFVDPLFSEWWIVKLRSYLCVLRRRGGCWSTSDCNISLKLLRGIGRFFLGLRLLILDYSTPTGIVNMIIRIALDFLGRIFIRGRG